MARSIAIRARSFRARIDKALSEVLGVVPEQVRVHTQLAGGSFGRRAQFGSPYMREAAEAFKAAGWRRPVKHLWTREDDIRGGYYRPIFAHKVKAGLEPRRHDHGLGSARSSASRS